MLYLLPLRLFKLHHFSLQSFLATFREYAFLWMQDVQRTFEEFLAGNIVAHPRKMNRSELLRSRASMTSGKSRRDRERETRWYESFGWCHEQFYYQNYWCLCESDFSRFYPKERNLKKSTVLVFVSQLQPQLSGGLYSHHQWRHGAFWEDVPQSQENDGHQGAPRRKRAFVGRLW